MFFPYGAKELSFLRSQDAKLGQVIAELGVLEITIYPDPFVGILRNIVSQQISGKAFAAIWQRLVDSLPSVSPAHVLEAGFERLRSCGLSGRKVSYALELARRCQEEAFLDSLDKYDDREIIKRLTELPGIGVWSAEMFLLFSLSRSNILSRTDFGIRKGVQLLYAQELTPAYHATLLARYSPYASVASFYLWAVANGRWQSKTDAN